MSAASELRVTNADLEAMPGDGNRYEVIDEPGVGVIFDEYNGVIPDLVFATRETMRQGLVGGRYRVAPDIVIGILSPGATNVRRDRRVRRSLYALAVAKCILQTHKFTSGLLPGFPVNVETLIV